MSSSPPITTPSLSPTLTEDEITVLVGTGLSRYQVISTAPTRTPSKQLDILKRREEVIKRLLVQLMHDHPDRNWDLQAQEKIRSELNRLADDQRRSYYTIAFRKLKSFRCGYTRERNDRPPPKNSPSSTNSPSNGAELIADQLPPVEDQALLAQVGHGDTGVKWSAFKCLLDPKLAKRSKLKPKCAPEWLLLLSECGLTGSEAGTIFHHAGEMLPKEVKNVSDWFKRWYLNCKQTNPSSRLVKLVEQNHTRTTKRQATTKKKQAQQPMVIDPSKKTTTKKKKNPRPPTEFGDHSMWYFFWFILKHKLENEFTPQMIGELVDLLIAAGLVVPVNGAQLSFRDLFLSIHEGGRLDDLKSEAAFIAFIHKNVQLNEPYDSTPHQSDDSRSVDMETDAVSVTIHDESIGHTQPPNADGAPRTVPDTAPTPSQLASPGYLDPTKLTPAQRNLEEDVSNIPRNGINDSNEQVNEEPVTINHPHSFSSSTSHGDTAFANPDEIMDDPRFPSTDDLKSSEIQLSMSPTFMWPNNNASLYDHSLSHLNGTNTYPIKNDKFMDEHQFDLKRRWTGGADDPPAQKQRRNHHSNNTPTFSGFTHHTYGGDMTGSTPV